MVVEGGVRLCRVYRAYATPGQRGVEESHPRLLWPWVPAQRSVEKPQETKRPFFSSPSLQ